jgi:DNA mismatch repair protein MutL
VQRAAHAALAMAPRDDLPHIAFAPPNGGTPVRPGLWNPPTIGSAFTPTATTDEPSPASPTPTRGVPILRVLGQVSGTYIIAEGPEGMYLIDQHAAHERVMYEKILAQMTGDTVERQPLLDPLVVELTPDEHAAYERSRDVLLFWAERTDRY